MSAVHSRRENPRQRYRWKHSPWMLSCSLKRSCLALLAVAFLAVCDVWVKGVRASNPAVASCHTSKSNTLSDTYSSLFSLFLFSNRIPKYFQKFGKRHPQALIDSERCVIFETKIQNFDYPLHCSQCACLILALVCTPSPWPWSLWIESSQQEGRKSHSHSLISCNSCSRILPNTLDESVQPA